MHAHRWTVAFGAVLVAAGALWLALGAGMTFFADEWAFIEGRSLGNVADLFRPHNEHWSTLPVLLYRLMVDTLGIGSYLPYQTVVVALHLVVAALVFRLVTRRSGPAWGFLAGSLVALLGAGFENLFWGFQTGFVGSMALGLLALEVTDRGPTVRRAWLVAGLLVLSLMASGVGIAMCVTVGITWLLDAGWRRWIGILAIPATAYAAWLAAFGRTGLASTRSPFSADAAFDAARFVVLGMQDAMAAVTGLGSWLGLAAAGVVFATVALRVRQGRLEPLAGGALAAVVINYALIGIARGAILEDHVHYSRYVYVSGILLVLAISGLVGVPRLPQRRAPRLVAAALVPAMVGLAVTYNVLLAAGGRELFLERANMTRALLTAGLRRPLPTETDPDRSLVLVPSPASLERLLAYGDPRMDALVPGAVRPIPSPVQAEADRRVREGAPIPTAESR